MIGATVTLVAATPTKIVTGGIGSSAVFINTALTDVFVGGSNVNATTHGCPVPVGGVIIPIGSDDLWVYSAGGGALAYAYAENG